MAATKRNKMQLDNDRRRTADLYLHGWTMQQIADEIGTQYEGGLTVGQIAYDIRVLIKRWRKEQLKSTDELMTRELERINRIEREAWDAWERSKQPVSEEIKKGRRRGESDDGTAEIIRRTREQVGDDRFLARVAWCVEQRVRLLRLHEASVTVNVRTWPQIVEVVTIADDNPALDN